MTCSFVPLWLVLSLGITISFAWIPRPHHVSPRTLSSLSVDAAKPWTKRWSTTRTTTGTTLATSSSATLEYNAERIRNFSIIAHIDHGKSTLADRILEATHTVAERDMEEQLLDNMDIERERGITIKLQAARVLHTSKKDGKTYTLNLIDTPGHVDFSYEVSRSLAACEGALLVVDASQGIEAQTLANAYLALENDLEIIPVLNKIDLPSADPDRVAKEIEDTLGLDCSNIIKISAKLGLGIEDVLEAIVERVPPPPVKTTRSSSTSPMPPPKAVGNSNSHDGNGKNDQHSKDEKPFFRALIFDSYFDTYRGVIVFFRVVDGKVREGDKLRFMASGAEYEVTELGVMTPKQVRVDALRAGEVGYLCGSIKDVLDARVGDTISLANEWKSVYGHGKQQNGNIVQDREELLPLEGYADSVPMVYSGLFPVNADDYESLRIALGKLRLNDAALSYEPESSDTMGFGFRCGFLGLLHMEIVNERLSREYDLDLIMTAPSVVYKVRFQEKSTELLEQQRRRSGKKKTSTTTDNSEKKEEERLLIVDSPAKMPDLLTRGDEMLEPFVRMEILTPSEYNGAIMELCQERRGILQEIRFLSPTRSTIIYELPLAEVLTDFFDVLKGRTKGYASMEYSMLEYRASDLVRLDVKINYVLAPALACIVHRDKAQNVGRKLVASLKKWIPQQMFKVPIQACIGVKVVASETISAMRKDVLAKCYGGDITRKKKLLQKQARGKKRMKAIGKVSVPQEAFMAVLKLDNNDE